jgi:hypothetical protein
MPNWHFGVEFNVRGIIEGMISCKSVYGVVTFLENTSELAFEA